MGNELLPRTQYTKEALAKRQSAQLQFVEEMFEAENNDWLAVCEKLAKGDVKAGKRWRQRARRWMQEPYFQELVGSFTMAELRLGLPGMAAALNRRAAKGNIPAAKLLMEATGFHNPRVDHSHSGEVVITLRTSDRPELVEDVDQVVDATVVE